MRTLLKEFLSSELVSTASEDQLALVVGRAAARKVRAHYRAWGSDSLGGQVPQSGFPQTNAFVIGCRGDFGVDRVPADPQAARIIRLIP